MEDSREVVRNYCERACAELQILPPGEARDSLAALAEYVPDRQRNRASSPPLTQSAALGYTADNSGAQETGYLYVRR